MGKRGMRPDDVHALAWAGDPRLSPDGSTVAFVVSAVDGEENTYTSAIWLAPADGRGEPRRFTFGTKRDATPRWSPDGRWLAFTSTRDADEAQLYVIPADGGEARKLTDRDQSVAEPVWAPDSERLAFTCRVRDEAYEEEDDKRRRPRHITRLKFRLDSVGWTFDRPKQLFTVDRCGGEPVQLTSDEAEVHTPVWSPDGRRIVFTGARHDDWDIDLGANALHAIPAGGGEITALTQPDAVYGSPSFSPDGTRIACTYSPGREVHPRHARIAVLGADGTDRRVLTSTLDRNCSDYFLARKDPVWDDGRLLFCVEDRGNTHLYAVDADGSSDPEVVVDGELRLTGYDARNGVTVYSATSHARPAEVFTDQGPLTDVTADFCGGRTLAEPERFTATSPDGSEVDGWIMTPPHAEPGRRYPVLLNIHGGPFTQYGTGFFDEFQVYADAGYVVVFSNPRGSSGYSEAWGQAIRGPAGGAGPGWGTVDAEDVLAVLDHAIEHYPVCDPDRQGVMGGSYGGYLTSWLVAHTDRFRAACSERAVNSWSSMYGASDFGWPFAAQFGAHYHEDPDAWHAVSPVSYATNITTPLLILHSENDLRCPIEQAEQLFTTLRLLKRDVEFVRFPAESHELSRAGSPVHRVQRFEVILDWFDRKLKA